MSLLMQALKKAEQAKKQSASASGEVLNHNQLPPATPTLALDEIVPLPEQSPTKLVAKMDAMVDSTADSEVDDKVDNKVDDAVDDKYVKTGKRPHIEPQLSLSERELFAPDAHKIAIAKTNPVKPETEKLEIEVPMSLEGMQHQATRLKEADFLPLSGETFSSQPIETPAQIEPALASSVASSPAPSFVSAQTATKEQKQPTPNLDAKVKQSQQMAQTIFAAKQPVRFKRFVPLIGGGVIGTILCVGAGFYYWQTTPYPNRSTGSQPVKQSQQVADIPMSDQKELSSTTNSPALASDATRPTISDIASAAINVDNAGVIAGKSAEKRIRAEEEFNESRELSRSENLLSTQQVPGTQIAAMDQIKIHKATISSTINSNLMKAYRFFSAGDVNSAQPLYEAVIRAEPDNRDALLGIAAIALNQNQQQKAAALYSKLLDLDPSDPDAIAGLISLRSGDPVQSESQLKKVLAQNPQSGSTLFELGNLYTQQLRWSEAQDVYFRALGTSPANADYAFNLAISLDRLGQINLATEYYQRALTLSVNAPGKFSQDAAKTRILQLQQVTNQ